MLTIKHDACVQAYGLYPGRDHKDSFRVGAGTSYARKATGRCFLQPHLLLDLLPWDPDSPYNMLVLLVCAA